MPDLCDLCWVDGKFPPGYHGYRGAQPLAIFWHACGVHLIASLALILIFCNNSLGAL